LLGGEPEVPEQAEDRRIRSDEKAETQSAGKTGIVLLKTPV